MNAIDYAKYADVALAAYGSFSGSDPSGGLPADFATSQATSFANNWTVVSPSYSDASSDFQATLFQEKLPSGNDIVNVDVTLIAACARSTAALGSFDPKNFAANEGACACAA